MTPLRVFQAVAQKMVQATESVAGVMKIATQTQVSAGVDDSSVVTPKKLRAGFKASINANGYMAFPTWMGGLIIQWGTSQSDANGNGSLTFPMAYPSEFYGIWYGDASGSISGVNAIGTLAYSKTGVTFGVRQVASTAGTLSAFFWLSIGK
ncbi:gp53-like domain-containing protein [Pseudomonas delhiensis]|uniref:gp53-like domain-containing protein n=1 Tax=Pseudomonas delhiensis TaxID=366289 RepID=UPI003CC91D9E